jgi:hypothetical protein
MGALAQKSESPVADYFPLRAGDSWTYRSTSKAKIRNEPDLPALDSLTLLAGLRSNG